MTFHHGQTVWVIDRENIQGVIYVAAAISEGYHEVRGHYGGQMFFNVVYPTFHAACRAGARRKG